MIEELRIIAKDGGRITADDCRLIGVAADALEEAWQQISRLGADNIDLVRQTDALRTRIAELEAPKPPVASVGPLSIAPLDMLGLAHLMSRMRYSYARNCASPNQSQNL